MEVFFKKGLGSTKVSGIHYDDVKPQLRSQAHRIDLKYSRRILNNKTQTLLKNSTSNFQLSKHVQSHSLHSSWSAPLCAKTCKIHVFSQINDNFSSAAEKRFLFAHGVANPFGTIFKFQANTMIIKCSCQPAVQYYYHYYYYYHCYYHDYLFFGHFGRFGKAPGACCHPVEALLFCAFVMLTPLPDLDRNYGEC